MKFVKLRKGVYYNLDEIRRLYVVQNLEGEFVVKIYIQTFGEFVLRAFQTDNDAYDYLDKLVRYLNGKTEETT